MMYLTYLEAEEPIKRGQTFTVAPNGKAALIQEEAIAARLAEGDRDFQLFTATRGAESGGAVIGVEQRLPD